MNIQDMIQDLRARGLSDNAIARKAQVAQATITRIKRGDVGGSLKTANKINALHKEIIGRDSHEPASS